MTDATPRGTEQIPERPGLPLVGHALDIPSDTDGPLQVRETAKEPGPPFKVRVFGNGSNLASGLDFVAEPGDESRFHKNARPDLVTAANDEPNRHKAHDILMPAFAPPEKRPPTELASAEPATFHEQVTVAGRGVLDLLERYRACGLRFETILELVQMLRPRHCPISSSAEAVPGEVDLMVSLLAAPHGSGQGAFRGIGLNYLQTTTVGDTVQARLLPCSEAFRLPVDDSAPAIPVSAGTGPAPFHGTVLDRHRTEATGTLLCHFGCDRFDVDHLHREESEAAEASRAFDMRLTISHARQDGARFVQDRIAKESDEVWAVLEGGGRIYICGDGSRTAPAVREAFMAIYRKYTGAGDDESCAWLLALIESGYYVEDVWAD
ncbi:hypothetical protein GCM10023084_63340 [Streptomyces lacrimifluminis]